MAAARLSAFPRIRDVIDTLQCLKKYGQRLDLEIASEMGVPLATVRRRLVSLAAKGMTGAGEIRVVHVPTGEIVFRKPAPQLAEGSEEL